VIAEESAESNLCRQLAQNHVDMMFHVLCQLGYGIALDSAARGTGIKGKPRGVNSAAAPVLVDEKKPRKSFPVCGTDARTTLNLARICEARGRLTWLTRSGRTRSLRMSSGWLTVKQARKAARTSECLVFSQWDRHRFTLMEMRLLLDP